MAVTATINTSALEFGNRLDAELYRPSLRASYDTLLRSKYSLKPLKRLCVIQSGTTPADRDDGVRSGPILFKTTDIRNDIISSDGDYYHISDGIHARMAKSRLRERDVLLNIVGASLDVIGRTAFVCGLSAEANITQAMALLRPRVADVLSGFVFAFLNTRFGQDQIARFARPTGQYNLNLREVGAIGVPIVPSDLQATIEALVLTAAEARKVSRSSYLESQTLLESELGLDKLTIDPRNTFTTMFSNVESARRIDAHHYHPTAIAVLDHVARFSSSQIRDVRHYNRRGVQPAYVADGDVAVINSQHITARHLDYAGFAKTSSAGFLRSPEAHVRPDDILIYSTGAYVGRANVYLSSDPALASNHVSILRVGPDIDSAYLSMVLQSIVGRAQTQMHVRGSTQVELYPSDIDRCVVPLLPRPLQVKIGNLVRDSLEKQRESARLLDEAKARVEQIIKEAVAS